MGVGEAKQDAKMLERRQEPARAIAGQQPNIRRARKSVAAFKLREGMPVGLTVTLRERARVRVPRPPDARRDPADPRLPRPQPALVRRRGNYSMGVREQIIFPEIDYDTHRPGARPGRHHHDHRADRSPRPSRC
jgi:large subunit ribosomal protein L5